VPPVALRVLLCDDAIGFPDLVASWIAAAPDLELVATASDATEMLEVLPDAAPDVVLLDLMLPEGLSSPELVRRVRELAPGVRVILISSMPAAQLAGEGERTGVDALSPKWTTAEAMLALVRGA
jgi:DNA-binding NarL/FixJ family response regulator